MLELIKIKIIFAKIKAMVEKIKKYKYVIGGVLVLLIILISLFFHDKSVESTNISTKGLTDIQDEAILNKIEFNKKVDSLYSKLDSLSVQLAKDKTNYITHKTITNQYYTNEKQNEIITNTYSDYALDSIITSAKYEPYKRK